MKTLYIVPGSSFFKEKWGGRTAHVIGVVEGLIEWSELSVIGGKGLIEVIGSSVSAREVNRFVNFKEFIYLYLNHKFFDLILVRKTFVFMCLSLLYPMSIRKEILWEVNGLSNWGAVNPNSYLEKIVFWLHKTALKSARSVYVVTPLLKMKLESIGIPEKKIIVVPNGVPSHTISSKWVAGADTSLLFFGVLRKYNDWSLLNSFLRDNFAFSLNVFGYHLGSDSLELDLSPDNITFHGKSSVDKVIAHIEEDASNTIGLVPMKDIEDSRLGSPIKLYDYLSFGIPVLLSSATYLDKELQNSLFIGVYDATDSKLSFKKELQRLVDRFDNSSEANINAELVRIRSCLSWKSRMKYLIEKVS
jgi:hypothetical protein